MAVVGGSGQEEAVLEPWGHGSHGARALAVYGVAGRMGWGSVMRFVQDQHGARPKFPKQVTQSGHVGLIGQQVVGDDIAAAGFPRNLY